MEKITTTADGEGATMPGRRGVAGLVLGLLMAIGASGCTIATGLAQIAGTAAGTVVSANAERSNPGGTAGPRERCSEEAGRRACFRIPEAVGPAPSAAEGHGGFRLPSAGVMSGDEVSRVTGQSRFVLPEEARVANARDTHVPSGAAAESRESSASDARRARITLSAGLGVLVVGGAMLPGGVALYRGNGSDSAAAVLTIGGIAFIAGGGITAIVGGILTGLSGRRSGAVSHYVPHVGFGRQEVILNWVF